MKPILVFILGPTASGKSEVAVRLAERIGGEIISCDSMQVYSDMEILTQAPGKDMVSRVKHHLLGVIKPEEEFSVAKFIELAAGAIEDILSRGKIPVLSGGTGLYVKALLEGLFSSPPKDKELREKLEREALEKGNMHLYGKLKKIDPKAASGIDPQNIRRVIRALEVFELTGKTFSEKKTETKGIGDRYNVGLFALEVPRDVLIGRIEKRVDKMFFSGLVDEVKELAGRKVSLTASKALGLKEVSSFVSGEIGLDEVKEELKIKTRQYAKRQMTWLRAVNHLEWVDAERAVDEIVFDVAERSGFAG